ncbi:MAG: UDP-N-acetylmuramoyl-L-alanyl-D-glutamate--2,6-diaminopimelate ligase [Oscillospiraceae bacterium]|nr:UDP-N-acetylmuramoyl-L-alanyl-D-glutamate--2,6-diaminopimelate ligase [Oscillospiraceae bacterium]
MRLSELWEAESPVPGDPEITSVTDDSRKVTPGCLYVCVRGERFDGHTKAAEALAAGAAAVVTEEHLGLGEREITVPDSRACYGQLCAAWFSHPERKMRFVGVTGTNGKTTVTTLIKQILTACGYKVGLIGTIQNEIGDEILHTDNTTPLTFELMALYDRMQKAGCDFVVMEVSSFGLVQKRIGPTHFEVAVFTNLTQDHLDYHHTMEDYYQAKRMLFSLCDKAVIYGGDEYGRRLYAETSCEKYDYGTEGNFAYTPVSLRAGASEFTLRQSCGVLTFRTRLTGEFNVANATAAYAACKLLGIADAQSIPALEACPGVKGRCEVIPTGRDFTVICDYAHTPDAIENILSALRPVTQGQLVCLFGCGGDRDAAKRPLMAQAAAKYADRLIVTSDNPRSEDPAAIIADILVGLEDSPVDREVVTDRRQAIFHAVETAGTGDVIVLAGKGHEDYQIFEENRRIHFDEREIVAEALAASAQEA